MKVFLVLIGLFISACNNGSGSFDPVLNNHVRDIISERSLTGNPAAGRDLPDINSPLAQLGKKLFFSKTLGGDFDSACVSCHHPQLGGGDASSLSIGVGAYKPDLLGPGRIHPDGDLTVPRNAPTTFNIALWVKDLFWDGRIESLSGGIRTPDSSFNETDPFAGSSLPVAQSRFPVTSPDEMRGFTFAAGLGNEDVRSLLAERLQQVPAWQDEFEKAFGSREITFAKVVEAIAAYERSQIFVDTPWRRYIEGDDTSISDSAKQGALLFFRDQESGGVNCASCHRGDFFTDEEFYSIAAPQIGRGKGNGASGSNDFGRFRESKDAKDKFSFRTPTLLNVGVTAPYLHSGAYFDLESVIRHHLDPISSLASFNTEDVYPAKVSDFDDNTFEMLEYLKHSGTTISSFSVPVTLSDEDIQNIVAFLETLTDPCTKSASCLSPWIAGREDNLDGNMLKAEF